MQRHGPILLALCVACGDSESGEGDETSTSVTTSSGSTTTDATTTASSSSTDTSTSTSSAESSSSSADESSSTGTSGDTVTLQNDGWTPMDSLTWETWPSPGDCWASTYEIDASLYPFDIVAIAPAIGGADDTQTFEVGIWEVDGDGFPTTPIDTVEVDIAGNVETSIDVEAMLTVPTIASGSFATVMCHVDHMGVPSIAIDVDGSVDADHNFVFQMIDGDWVRSPDFFGTAGDFVLRTTVRPM